MPRTARGISNTTIGDLIDEDYGLGFYYNNTECRHNVAADLEMLAERLGRDHGSMHWDLAPKLRCSKCGGKNVSLQIRPPVPRGRL